MQQLVEEIANTNKIQFEELRDGCVCFFDS